MSSTPCLCGAVRAHLAEALPWRDLRILGPRLDRLLRFFATMPLECRTIRHGAARTRASRRHLRAVPSLFDSQLRSGSRRRLSQQTGDERAPVRSRRHVTVGSAGASLCLISQVADQDPPACARRMQPTRFRRRIDPVDLFRRVAVRVDRDLVIARLHAVEEQVQPRRPPSATRTATWLARAATFALDGHDRPSW